MNRNKKHSNLLRALDLIIRTGSISRIDLAEKLGLTRAAIGQLCDELLGRELIKEAGTGETRGGRPPTLLSPVPEGCYFIGAAVFDFSWSLILMDLSGNIIDQKIHPIEEMSPECAIATLSAGVLQLRELHSSKNILNRIGIGSPGLVDSREGMIVSAVDVGWNNVRLGEVFTEQTSLPCLVVNRSKVSALTAYYLDNPGNIGNIISIVIGTGVASGIILEHKLFNGSSFGAGELGHTTVIPNGPLCRCGNRGCLQALIGEEAILERGRNLARVQGIASPLSINEILCDSSGNGHYRHVIEETAEYLSIALGNIINLLNPDMVVLSGPVIGGCPALVDMVKSRNEYRAMKHNLDAVRIVSSEWGNRTAAIGSALLVRESTEDILKSNLTNAATPSGDSHP